MRHNFTCVRCSTAAMQRRNINGICMACARERSEESKAATRVVVRLIKSGALRKAKHCTCVDCSRPAFDYDHRDYMKPADVEPVCRSCNLRRGPALDSRMRSYSVALNTRAQGPRRDSERRGPTSDRSSNSGGR